MRKIGRCVEATFENALKHQFIFSSFQTCSLPEFAALKFTLAKLYFYSVELSIHSVICSAEFNSAIVGFTIKAICYFITMPIYLSHSFRERHIFLCMLFDIICFRFKAVSSVGSTNPQHFIDF